KAFKLEKYPFFLFSIAVVTTYALAALYWNLLEKPFLRLNRLFDGAETTQNLSIGEIANPTQT
ncbi:MAG: hypothetical protein P4L50_16510, partial [Anaerolineaceae bacterium]|nr:hypothetical protein [Anaerolineaceae bacterium]